MVKGKDSISGVGFEISGYQVAVYFAAASSVGLVVLLWLLSLDPHSVNESLLLAQVEEFGMESTTRQLALYLCVVAALGFTAAYALLEPSRPVFCGRTSGFILPGFALVLSMVLFLFSNHQKRFAIAYIIGLSALLLAARFGADFSNFSRLLHSPYASAGSVLFIFVIVVLFVLIPLRIPPHVSGLPELIAYPQNHYAGTLMPGFDYACCTETGSVASNPYGYSLTLLTAFGVFLAKLVSVESGSELLFTVRLFQILGIAMLAVIAVLVNRRHSILVFGFLLCISLGHFASSSGTLSTPNHAAIRFIPFLAGIALLAWIAQQQRSFYPLLPAVGGFLAAATFEIGVPILAGFLMYVLLKSYNPKRARSSVIKALVGSVALALIAFLVSERLFRIFIATQTNASLFDTTQTFLSGYGQLSAPPEFLFGLVFFLAAATILRIVFMCRVTRLANTMAFQAAIAIMILTWLPYYINRMSYSNLFFACILIGILGASQIDRDLLSRLTVKRSPDSLTLTIYGATIFAVSAFSIWGATSSWLEFVSKQSDCKYPAVTVSGFCYKGPASQQLRPQLKVLGELDPRETLVVTHFSTQSRLLGLNEGFPYYEPFSQLHTDEDIRQMAEWIDRNGPEFVLFDDPGSATATSVSKRTDTLEMVAQALSCYLRVRVSDSWVQYRRDHASDLTHPCSSPVGQSD